MCACVEEIRNEYARKTEETEKQEEEEEEDISCCPTKTSQASKCTAEKIKKL